MVRAVEESAKLQTNLTKELFEDQDVTTVPARSSNDTVSATLSMTLLKVIELVWTQQLLLSQQIENIILKVKLYLIGIGTCKQGSLD